MSEIVIDLQNEIINDSCDIMSVLRKAHLIAAKLNLKEFDEWIMKELNGYENYEDIPDYREVIGEIKAYNSMYGLIPVMLPESLAKNLNSRKLFNSISEIVELSKNNKSITINLPTELSKMLCAEAGITFPCYFIFGAHCLLNIIERVKNTILQWCINLEKDGILGSNLKFDEKEKEKAKEIPQQINYYYGQVINGDVNSSTLTANNTVNNYDKASDFINELEKQLANEKIDALKMNDALEVLNDVKESISKKKKPSIIRGALMGLKDFLISAGASVTANLISAKINGLF